MPLIPVHPNCNCYYTIVDDSLKAMDLQRFSNKSSTTNDESDIINNKGCLKAEFPNEKKFNTHVNKHSYQYGNISPNEYLELARKLLASNLTKDIDGFISADRFIFKYNKKQMILQLVDQMVKYQLYLNQIIRNNIGKNKRICLNQRRNSYEMSSLWI